MRTHKRKLGCNSVPNVSMYNTPCNGGIPLDNAFTKSFQNGGGYFFDVGNPAVIQPGVPAVQGYSECCHPVFNTSGYEGNGNFNASGYLESVNGAPVCGAKGGGRTKGRGRTKGGANGSLGKGYSRKYGKNKRKKGNNRGKNKRKTQGIYTTKGMRKIVAQQELKLKKQSVAKQNQNQSQNKNKKQKKKHTQKHTKKGGGLPMSNFNENMVHRDFGCVQPKWNPNCV